MIHSPTKAMAITMTMNNTLRHLGYLAIACLLAVPKLAMAVDHEHRAFTKILGAVVVEQGHQSRVDYQKLVAQRDKLELYLSELSAVSRQAFDQWPDEARLAFLINTYNAYQLKQVIDHYPIDSIKDVGSFFSSPWSKSFFTLFGESASLDYVEHEMIRQWFDEPRIHFAVNCASISCPPLRDEAYVGVRLDQQLNDATLNFLMDKDANYLEGNTLYVSKIFDWYEEDFKDGVIAFVKAHRPNWFEGTPDVKYTDYDWNLNEVSTR